MTRSTTAALLFALTVVPMVCAQSPVAGIDAQLLPQIERRLEADSATQVAWGGYLAQRYRLRGASRALCAALDRWKDRDGLEARIVRLHLVDGLLGIDAKVPAEQVEFLLKDKLTRAAAFAVIAGDAAANLEGLVRIALEPAEYNEIVRRAAGRLLVARGLRSPALAKHVLDNLKFSYNVIVTDVRELWDTVEAEGPSGAVEYTKTKAGFPPLVRIELSGWNSAKGTMRSVVPGLSGKSPIVLTRKEHARYQPTELERGRMRPALPGGELLCLLNHMSGVHQHSHSHHKELFWTNEKDFLARYVPDRDQLRKRLDKVVVGLRKKKWLPSDYPDDYRIQLAEVVHDERSNKSVDLPKIPEAPARAK